MENVKRYTTIDWSKHILTVLQSDTTVIYTFADPETVIYKVVWIVGNGITAVTGDFGNWIFGAEFYPNIKQANVSYMNGYLRHNSTQEISVWDDDEILESIEDFVNNFESSYGREMDEDELDWIESLKNSSHDEIDYMFTAYRETPNNIETEDVPFSKKLNPYLNSIYDAFNQMCLLVNKNYLEM